MAMPPLPPLNLTGGAGGSAGPSGAEAHLSNPFASGDFAVSYGGNASTSKAISPWVLGGAALLIGVVLWKRYA